MGYYFGKGATAPTDEFAASPGAPGAPDNKANCIQTCNERYQKDLDNPSVDYATAQQRYNDCKTSCQDIPAIQEQAQSVYGRTMGGGSYEEDREGGGKPGPPGPGGGGGPGGEVVPRDPNVPGDTPCHKACNTELRDNLEKGMQYPAAMETWRACIAKCEDPGGIFCKGGYESNTKVDGVFPACKEGFAERTMPNGTRWCCPGGGDVPEGCVDFIEGQACEEGMEIKMYNGKRYCCPEGGGGGGGTGCEGGHILDDRYKGGGGGRALTTKELDGVIPADAGWTRNAAWGEHIIYHPDYGFRNIIEVYDFYKGGESGWSGHIDWACEKGMERKEISGESWCCPRTDTGGGGGGLGEYQWPSELTDLYNLLMGRGKEFMGMDTGYTDEAIQAMFGKNFENIRDVGSRTAETGLSALQREGLMGTGASQDLASEAAWGTEKGISDLTRDLLVMDEEKKKQDLLDYTGAAQNIFGGGMGYNSLLEQMNAGRRGESRESLAMLLQYLMSLMSSWGA